MKTTSNIFDKIDNILKLAVLAVFALCVATSCGDDEEEDTMEKTHTVELMKCYIGMEYKPVGVEVTFPDSLISKYTQKIADMEAAKETEWTTIPVEFSDNFSDHRDPLAQVTLKYTGEQYNDHTPKAANLTNLTIRLTDSTAVFIPVFDTTAESYCYLLER